MNILLDHCSRWSAREFVESFKVSKDTGMNYTVTDAVEQDARKELETIRRMNEEIDQLASDARDLDVLSCEPMKRALDLAWFFCEDQIRETTGACSAHSGAGCQCCRHFNELKPKAESLRGRLA